VGARGVCGLFGRKGQAADAMAALRRAVAAVGVRPLTSYLPRAAFSSLPVAAEESSLFTKYSSPVPEPISLSPSFARPETKLTTLSNGLRVATETDPYAKTATVGVWIDAGSRYETDATNGTAHFLEHLIFKGTARRSQQQLELEIENMGGHLNAYTSREQTTYYARVMQKDVPQAVDILSDILQNSTFSESAIERERNVILREMQEVEGQNEEVLFDHLHATAFQGSPLARTILGSAENVQSISKANLSDYIANHYSAPRTVIAAAGAVDHDALVKLCEEKFASLSSDPTTAASLVEKEPSFFTGSDVRLRDDDMSKLHFAVSFKGASWTDPDAIPLMVLNDMLGTWSKRSAQGKHMGSEMVQRFAANDLGEHVMAFNTSYSDTGLFGVYCITDRDKADDAAWVVMNQMAKMIYSPEPEDIERAKNQLKAGLVLHLDGTSAAAEDIGRSILTYGRRIPLEELYARIDMVDVETIKRVADRFIYDKEPAIAAMGPSQFLPDYNWFRRNTYWLRF